MPRLEVYICHNNKQKILKYISTLDPRYGIIPSTQLNLPVDRLGNEGKFFYQVCEVEEDIYDVQKFDNKNNKWFKYMRGALLDEVFTEISGDIVLGVLTDG